MAVTAGTHAVDSVPGFGTAANSSGQCMLVEVSGLNTALLVDATGGVGTNSTTPSATTGVLTSANQIVFAVCMGVTALTGATTPPTSGQLTFTNLYSDLSATELATVFSYGLVSPTAAITASWATLNSTTLTATALATFQQGTAGAYSMLADQGSYTRIGSPGTLDFYVEANNGTET